MDVASAKPRRGAFFRTEEMQRFVRAQVVLAAVFACCGAVQGAAVAINPPAGAETNVTARLTGATDVAINEAATGGGIVRLNAANSYTGGTSLNSGTLVLRAGDGGTGMSDIGTGGLTLGAATIRYAGNAGGLFSARVTNTFAAATKQACVLDVQKDLVVTNDWVQNYGTFVKTGPGTVIFRGKHNAFGGKSGNATSATLNDTKNPLAFNASGDGPTTGVTGGFVLAEGTMVVEGDDDTVNYFNNSTQPGSIGTWTTNDGQEKSAVLEIRGGNNYMRRPVIPGYHNGNATTGGSGVSSGLRVTGGSLCIGTSSNMETVFVGGSTSGETYTHNTHPFIDVTGGRLEITRNLQLGNQSGVHTRLHVGGTGRLELGQYVGCGYTAGPSQSSVDIDGNGVLQGRYIELFTAAGASTFDVRLAENGVFAWTVTNNFAFFKQSTSTPGTMNVLIDGGMVSNTVTGTTLGNLQDVFSYKENQAVNVSVGDRGAKFVNSLSGQRYAYRVPFAYTNTVAGGARSPVEFLGNSDSKRCHHYLYDAFQWDGPVRVGLYAYLYFQANATFAANDDLILCRDARLINNVNAQRTVRNLQIGEAGTTGGITTFFLTTNTSIRVSGELRVPSTTGLRLYLTGSSAWNAPGSGLTTPGDYVVLTVPASSRAALEGLSTEYATACPSYFHIVDNGDDTLSLKLKILSEAAETLSVVGESMNVATLGGQSAYGDVSVGAGGRLVVTGSSTLKDASGNAVNLRLVDGGELIIYNNVVGASSSTPYGSSVYFDGGICSYANAENDGGVNYFRYVNFYVGAKGAIFDTSARAANGGEISRKYLHIGGIWAKDPALGDAPDGGITFRGRGIHYLGGTFGSTLEGDFTVTDQSQLMIYKEVAKNQRVVIKPGCALRGYESSEATTFTTKVKDLVLGEAGSVTPVTISSAAHMVNAVSFVVTGALTVHSPVYFGTRTSWINKTLLLREGQYQVVVFKDGSPDITKFQADPSITGFETTFSLTDITEGDYAGYKAVVATVVAKTGASAPLVGQRWTANADGGAWANDANWANGEKPGVAATFAAPQGASVPVTMDETPHLRRLTVEGTEAGKGYVFGGTKGFFFEAGALTTLTKMLETGVGNVRFDVPVKVEGPLSVTNAVGSTVAFAGGLEGTGTVTANPSAGRARGVAGEVTVGDATTGGALVVGTGRVTAHSLAWVQAAADLSLDRGTLAYTGSGETIPGFRIAGDKTSCAVLDVSHDLAVESIALADASTSGSFLKIGAGDLRLKGTGTFTFGVNSVIAAPGNADDGLVLANGDGPTNTISSFSLGAGRVIVGTTGDATDAPMVVVGKQMAVGIRAGAGASPELVLNNGSLTIASGHLRVGFYDTLGETMTMPKVTVNGGCLATAAGGNMNLPEPYGANLQNASPTFTLNDGVVHIKGAVRLGYCQLNPDCPSQVSTLTVNGGTFTTGDFILGNYDAATKEAIPSYLNLNGGVTTVTNELNLSRNAVGTSVVTLNEGAVLRVGSITSKRTGGKFVFNGGTLFITGKGSTDTKSEFVVGAKGAVISTAEAPNGQAVLKVALKHDPSLGDTPDGGLVKRGPGVLVLSQDSTFTGPIVVEEGEVVRGGCDIGETGDLTLAADSTISCFGAPNEWSAGVRTVTGDFIAMGRVYVDFGRTEENPIAVDELYPIAVVGGSVRSATGGEIPFRPLNAPQGISLKQEITDGVLYVRVVMRGMVILVR